MCNEIRLLIEQKKKLHYKLLSSNNISSDSKFMLKVLRFQLKSKIKQKVTEFEFDIAHDKCNPKRLFSYTKSRQVINSGIDSILVNGTVSTDPTTIANALNKQFQSVFVDDSSDHILPTFPKRTNFTLNDINFDIGTLQKILSSLKPNKSLGPDLIHPFVLKATATTISTPLALLYTIFFESGTMPPVWTEANITPLHKKGSRTIPANYRPISLTSVPCKVMETIINKSLKTYLNDNHLLTIYQHGFVDKKACVTNLLETSDYLLITLLPKKQLTWFYSTLPKPFTKFLINAFYISALVTASKEIF